MTYVLAFLLSTLGGHFIVGALVWLMRRTVCPPGTASMYLPARHQLFYHLWVGITERAIATTLFIWAPGQVALFIGGWTALKLAAAWTRRTRDKDHTVSHILALHGCAFSFAVAIGAGMLAHPESLNAINGVVESQNPAVASPCECGQSTPTPPIDP